MESNNCARRFKAIAFSTLFTLAILAPVSAWCDEPQEYFTRHFTVWYYSEDGFNALEDTLREGPLAGIAGYGPESDFLAVRMERLYELTAASLRVFPQGQRLRTVLLDGRPGNADIFNSRGISVAGGAAHYDPVTETLYVNPGKAGLCDITRELANALLHADSRLPAQAESRNYVSVSCAREVCGYISEEYLSGSVIDALLY